MKQNKKLIYGIVSTLVVAILIFMLIPQGHSMSMDEKREAFIELRNNMHQDLLPQGQYRCCLENPCNTCLALTPWHGEGPECNCLEDLVNGEAPCGECVGGILAGRGNPYLKEYFAKSIAEEVGEEYLPTLEKIVEQKYS